MKVDGLKGSNFQIREGVTSKISILYTETQAIFEEKISYFVGLKSFWGENSLK